jgi:hypothetical protein
VTLKSRSNQKPVYYVMYLYTRYTSDKNLRMIQSFVQELALFVFSVLAPWWPSQESDQTETWSGRSCDLGGTYVQSFRSIALAVTKCAVFTDKAYDRKSSPTVS